MLAQSDKMSSQQWTAPPGREISVTGNVQAKTKLPSIVFVGEESHALSKQK